MQETYLLDGHSSVKRHPEHQQATNPEERPFFWSQVTGVLGQLPTVVWFRHG
jgi:hypothetical protein